LRQGEVERALLTPERAGEGIFEFIDELLDAGEVEVDARSEKKFVRTSYYKRVELNLK
jgi:hypothetical protein